MASTAPDLNPIEAVWNMSNKSIDKQKNDTYLLPEVGASCAGGVEEVDFKKILAVLIVCPPAARIMIKNKGGYSNTRLIFGI